MASRKKQSTPRLWIGPASMEAGLVPIESIRPDPENSRVHNDRNIAAIEKTLMRWGQWRPAVLLRRSNPADSWCVIGNGMLEAAKRLGWTHLSVIEQDWSDAEARAAAIADNQTGELSYFDQARLSQQIAELVNEDSIEAIGFTDREIDRYVAAAVDSFPQVEDIPPDFDDVTPPAREKPTLPKAAPKSEMPSPATHSCPQCGFEF